MYFNPRSPHGERRFPMIQATVVAHFNPRSPHGERRHERIRLRSLPSYFNPRSPHGERQNCCKLIERRNHISIHAPRTGSDPLRRASPPSCKISIHAPRTGSDTRSHHVQRVYQEISIHAPRTGSDGKRLWSNRDFEHFNPRSPHGERQMAVRTICATPHFNPRSPHGERPNGQR